MSRQSPIEASEEDVIEIDFINLWLGKMCLCMIFCSNNICGDVGDTFEVEKNMFYLERQELSAACCASE